jgi:cyclopropane fatty-acyl-phospholipid synthase-like methyltransferase
LEIQHPLLYKTVLERLPNRSRILEVGIGNGICVKRNADLIRDKNLTILGIDIDPDYLKLCNQYIVEEKLEKQVKAICQDLLTMDTKDKFDCIFFMESYPVIPNEIMKQMMEKCKSLLSKNGHVSFVHNLVKSKNPFVDFIRPKLKYIPGVYIDFGVLTTHNEFDVFLKEVGYNCILKEVILVNTLNNMLPKPLLPDSLNYRMEQYLIECVPASFTPLKISNRTAVKSSRV